MWSEMYQKGYDNAAISFAYIPDFQCDQEKKDFETGLKDGYVAADLIKMGLIRKAIEQSIIHWKENLDLVLHNGRLRHQDIGSQSCPLCQLKSQLNYSSCIFCPVYKATGESGCKETPWDDISDHIYDNDELPVYIQKEIEFLFSLLEKE